MKVPFIITGIDLATITCWIYQINSPNLPPLSRKVWLANWLRTAFVGVLPTPKFMTHEDAKRIWKWLHNPLECLPLDGISPFREYCKEDRDLHERAIDILERKADWLMTLTVSVVGVAVLRITDAEHIHVETISWVIAHFLASWGMLCCLRARLPQTYPAPAKAIELQNWLIDYDAWHKQNPGSTPTSQTSSMWEAKLYAYTALIMKLVSEWKSKCVRAAGVLLSLAFLSLVVSFSIPVLSQNQESEKSNRLEFSLTIPIGSHHQGGHESSRRSWRTGGLSTRSRRWIQWQR